MYDDLNVRQVLPLGVYGKCLVLAASVYGCIVHVYDVLTFLAVRFYYGLLHLLYSELDGDDLGDAEECTLENSVGTIAETNLLCYLGGVDVVNGDVVGSKVPLDAVRQEVDKFLTFEDSVEQELAVGAKTAQDIIHAQICLYVTCYEVWCLDLVCRANRSVTKAQV